MIAAIYARKSTKQKAAAEDKSVTRQIENARAFAAERGWQVLDDHVYADDGVSGTASLKELKDKARMLDVIYNKNVKPPFNVLITQRCDRLSRHDGDEAFTEAKAITRAGVDIWSYQQREKFEFGTLGKNVVGFIDREMAAEFCRVISEKTREAMERRASEGKVTGGIIFGYDNCCPKCGARGPVKSLRCSCECSHVVRAINEAEAAVVREIYERFANGEGLRTIAFALNRAGAPTPRAIRKHQGKGWSFTTLRDILMRALYRGELLWGRTVKREVPELRIVDAELAARVDARREYWQQREAASKGKRKPQRAHGRFLLSGGMLLCPTCGGHFEAISKPWKGATSVYVCSTRRRKPGMCTNKLTLPLTLADNAVLDIVEDKALGTRFIEELLRLVETGEGDNTNLLMADRERLQGEVKNLVQSIAKGVPADTIAPAIREREAQIKKLDATLRAPRRVQPKIEELRAALEQRAAEWRETLRAEPTVARLLLRRLVGPFTLVDPSDHGAFDEWAASLTPGLLEGLATVQLVERGTGIEPA